MALALALRLAETLRRELTESLPAIARRRPRARSGKTDARARPGPAPGVSTGERVGPLARRDQHCAAKSSQQSPNRKQSVSHQQVPAFPPQDPAQLLGSGGGGGGPQ